MRAAEWGLDRDKRRRPLGFPSFTDPRWVGYIGRMAIDAIEIVRCPAELRAEALALVLCDLAPSHRRDVAGGLLDVEDIGRIRQANRSISHDGAAKLCGAAWGQRQSGNIAVFWPPQLEAGEDEQTAYRLAEAVVAELDETAVEMTQAFLSAPCSGSRKSFAARRLSPSCRFAVYDVRVVAISAGGTAPATSITCRTTERNAAG